jgi:general secretion pathway protein A
MNYFNILKFKKEPFSNSPEPEFLFHLSQYSDCLQKLELAVRLRRGINVVIGDIGTGKTTLCRKLIQNFSASATDTAETEIETHLLLDPAFNSAIEFLKTICIMLDIEQDDSSQSEWHLKEKIKNYLFNKGMNEKRIVVLIIDEGQKIPEECLELLREFLNYETNQFKLLQIIIFAQKEFHAALRKKANLLDRINLLYQLRPLNFQQTRAMINYRLSVARDLETLPSLFSFWGFVAIYLATKGYPRKIVFLCHQVVLKMIIREKDNAGWFLVRSCLSRTESTLQRKLGWALASILMIVVLGISVSAITLSTIHVDKTNKPSDNSVHEKMLPPDESDINNIKKMPDTMGKISMTPKRTVWWTLHNIYGDANPDIMQKILTANPHLSDKRKVMIGTTMTLPSIIAESKPIKTDDIVIALEIGQDLEKMYNIFRNNYNERITHPMGFLSYWNNMEGFQFAVVIDKKFKDINSAEEMRRKLPSEIATKAKIISQWNADTVFFRRRPLQY